VTATKKTAIPKLDLRKQYKELYHPSANDVVVVDVPELQFIALDGGIEEGVGPADSDSFQGAMGALYGVAYGLKFMSKLREKDPIDFTVMAMEGLWAAESGNFEFGKVEPWLQFGKVEPWLYTLLMMQPEHITQDMFERAVSEASAKRPNSALDLLRLGKWREGPSIQIMHIGPYSEERGTIEKMDAFAEKHGYQLHGRHHEIYLGDPRRAKPENLKTILRHPIAAE